MTAMSVYIKQNRFLLRPQGTFENIGVWYKPELSFLHSCIKQTPMYDHHIQNWVKYPVITKSFNEAMSPYLIRSIYFHALLTYYMIFGMGINKIITYLNCKTRVIQMISIVSRHTPCTQIFKDYSILRVASLYMLEVVCYIKTYKNWLEQNVYTFTTTKHEKQWPYIFSFAIQNSSGNVWCIWELRLYNKVPVHIKKGEDQTI
jgi:hypothetical protein